MEPLVVERIYDAPLSLVWNAITDLHALREWFFDLSDFHASVGFRFQFAGKGRKGESYLHLCEVTEVVFQRRLSFTWRYDGYDGNSVVTFELSRMDGGTKVKVTHEGLESFPVTNPDFAPESFLEGWTMLIGSLLKGFVEKKREE